MFAVAGIKYLDRVTARGQSGVRNRDIGYRIQSFFVVGHAVDLEDNVSRRIACTTHLTDCGPEIDRLAREDRRRENVHERARFFFGYAALYEHEVDARGRVFGCEVIFLDGLRLSWREINESAHEACAAI